MRLATDMEAMVILLTSGVRIADLRRWRILSIVRSAGDGCRMEINMAKGFIYIMTNPALKGMVKIGYAKDVEARRKQLSTTALPYEYEIYATYETSGNLEDKKLHKIKVLYNNEITSLSAISDRIKGYSTSGPTFFTYQGKTISQIAEETQWKGM